MEDKLDDKIKKYLEFELLHYSDYKKELEELKLDIIESSPNFDVGMPSSPNKGNEGQTSKVFKIMTTPAIIRLNTIISVIDTVVSRLSPQHKEFYDKYFIKYNKCNQESKKIKICMEMFIEERSFRRYKNRIINELARELGYLV